MARSTRPILTVLVLLISVMPALSQTATYHLHNQTSAIHTVAKQLTAANPNPPAVTLQTANLKNTTGTGDRLIASFETQTQVPNMGGMIPANSVVTFTLWMNKTAAYGTFYAHATLFLNNYCCSDGVFVCATNTDPGVSPPPPELTVTLTKYTMQCTVATAIVMHASDRFYVQVAAWMPSTGSPGNHNLYGQLNIEGTVDGNYDSKIVVPLPQPPTITSVTPGRGPHNTGVHIAGTNLGSTGTVTFNTTSATTSNWSATGIDATVPLTATGGTLAATVTATTNGNTSNGASFTVTPTPSITSLSPPAAAVGQSVTINGSYFLDTQAAGSSTVTFNTSPATPTSWSDTSITVAVPVGASSGPVIVNVSGNASTGTAFTVVTTGIIAGTITRTTGGTAIAGATVQAVLVGVVKGTGTSAANGTYSIANLDPGTYDVRVLATGFSSEVRSGTSVSINATTTVNVAMSQPGSIAGTVTQADGITPIAGAALTVYSGSFQSGSVSTNGSGTYSIGNLHPGAYTVQAANVGYRTKEQGAVVNENATTPANLSLDGAPTGPVLYAYDPVGRLIQVTDPSGDAAVYHYDAVGNVTAIDRVGSGGLAISGLSFTSGSIGTSIAVYGAGFGATQGSSTIKFNGTTATATSWSNTAIATTVPLGATTGPVVITANGQSSNGVTFSVTALGAGPPTITGFTPTLVATGDAVTVTGTNFDTTPANDRLTANLGAAQVTSATSTSLQATVPITTTGRVSIATPNGSGTSTDYLWVAPSPYLSSDVISTGLISIGTSTSIAVNTANKIALRAFDNVQGHRASVNLTGGTFSAGGTMAIYGVYGDKHWAGFASIGFLEPIDLTATGTYTFLLAPNSPGTGTATITVYDVPPDVTGSIVAGGSSVPVSVTTPGQNARLIFSGTGGNRVSVKADATIPAGTLGVLRPDGTTLGSVGFIANMTAFVDPLPLPTTGSYAVMVDPSTVNIGDATVTVYDVPADTTGTIAINGSSVPVTLGTPGQNGSLTFSGTQSQQVTVHVTGSTMGNVTVKLLSSDGQTVLSQYGTSAASFDLASATLPTAGTATYTITIDPSGANTGTMNLTVTSP